MLQFFTIELPYKVWKVNIAIPWTHDDVFYSKTDRNYSQIIVILKSLCDWRWMERESLSHTAVSNKNKVAASDTLCRLLWSNNKLVNKY